MPEKINIIELDIKQEDVVKKLAQLTAEMQKLNDEAKINKVTNEMSAEQVEINKGKLKSLSEEYRNNQKVLVNLTASGKDELGTLQQLALNNKTLRSEQQKLNLTTEQGVKRNKEINAQIEKNTKTIKTHSDAYVQQKMNIGNYQSALQSLPGPLGAAASKAQGLVANLSKFGPVAAGIGVAVGLIATPLIAFFTASEKGFDLMARKVAGFKAAIGVLRGELIKLGDTMVGDVGEKTIKWGNVFSKAAKIVLSSANLIPAVRRKVDELAESMNKAAEAAEKYTGYQQELIDLERQLLVPRALANKQLAEAKLLYQDDTKSFAVRKQALLDSIEIENKAAQTEIDYQNNVINQIGLVNAEKLKAGVIQDEDYRKLEEANARAIELDTESIQRKVAQAAAIKALNLKQATEDKAILDKKKADEIEAIKERVRQQEEMNATLADLNKLTNEAIDGSLKEQTDKNREHFETLKQYSEEYAAYQIELDARVKEAKLTVLADLSGSIASLFGEQTKVGKAAAIAETTINTYASATAAFKSLAGIPVVGPVLGGIAAAAAVTAGLANVKNILSVKSGLPGDSGGGSSSISTGATASISKPTPAQLSYAGNDVLTSRSNNGSGSGQVATAQNILVVDKVTAKQKSQQSIVEAAIA